MFDSLPSVLKMMILENLLTKEAIDIVSLSKDFREHIKEVVWKKSGALSYEDFINRIKKLPAPLKKLVLNEKNTLSYAEETYHIIVGFSPYGREKELQLDNFKQDTRKALSSPNGVLALRGKLITPTQAENLPSCKYLESLLSDNGLRALDEKLITPEEAKEMPDFRYLNNLLSGNGLMALHEKLITPAQAKNLPSFEYLYYLFSDNGLTALREKLITLEQVREVPNPRYLNTLFNSVDVLDNGVIALREKLITLEQAIKIVPLGLIWLLSDNGLMALREKLITPEQAKEIDPYSLKILFSDKGLRALRKKLVTPEQAKEITDSELEQLVKQDSGLSKKLEFHSGLFSSAMDIDAPPAKHDSSKNRPKSG